MKRILFLVALITILILSVGCSEVEDNGDLNEPFEYDYDLINENDLVEEAAEEWYQENRNEYGSYIYSVDETEKYLLISAGERNTGGYALEVEEVTESDQVVRFDIILNEPSADDMVTQVITYPSLLVKVTASNNFELEANLAFGESESTSGLDEELVHKDVEGIYVGQIDNNFIEVNLSENPNFRKMINIEEDFLSLKLTEASRNKLEQIESGEKILFTCYQDENNTWVVKNIKSNEDI